MPYTEAQKRATKTYKDKAYKRISLDVRVEEYEAFKVYCEAHGVAMNGLLRDYIREVTKKETPQE